MEFRVLGPIEVTENGQSYALGGPKQRAVLALLIAQSGRPVSTGSLIEGVYGDSPPQGARRSIQTYVSNLRGEMGEVIHSTSDGYELALERAQVDAFRFEDEVAVSRSDQPEAASQRLRDVLALWRGHPYSDVDAGELVDTESRRLNELRAQAIEARVEADLDLGRHRDLVPELESLTEEYPLRERFRAQQMLALYRCGRQAEALRAYERTRNYLVDEMGLDPSLELRDLEQRILEQDPELAFESGPTVRRAAVLVADVAQPGELASMAPSARDALIRNQSEALADAVDSNRGDLFAHRGSAIYAFFDGVDDALSASVSTQRSLDEPMRMAVSVGEVEIDLNGQVQGPPLTRGAQLVAAGHGGQILLSAEANQALADLGEAGWAVKSLGQHDVNGSGEKRAIYQLLIEDLPNEFAELHTEGLPPPLPIDVRGLPGYELREQVGSGAFGVVHRAYQPSVGREVAVKIIRPEYANDPDFIRHFEVEAQLVARLEHPHIVPLHDYWRSPEGAYLVMRWLRGGTLQDRIAAGPLSIEQADALVDQIAPALAFAHRHGVVHRDLKPSNILLDEDGAPYLSDFGIARLEATTEVGSVAGDVRDLAGIVAMSLHGQTSYTAVAELLTAATGDDSPYGDVGTFVEAWNTAVGDAPAPDHAATYTPTRNPFKGLQAFGELDADDFYGRDAEIAEIIDTLRERRFVSVVGPSGIGKSSVTRAGAIPALRRGAIEGSEKWLITDMMPGAVPFEELAAALTRVSVESPRAIEEELRESERGLARCVRRYLPEGCTLLLVIDQFEELFTLSSEADRAEILAMLAETASDDRSGVRIVITMRADFFDRPLRFAQLGEIIRDGTVLIASPRREALRAMIERPAAAVGVDVETGLATRIASEVHDQPGALPLLQYAMAELFEHRATDTITSAEYDDSGGVLGALGTRAEAVYVSLDPGEQESARQVFLRLVRISDGGQVTRRRVRYGDLESMGSSSGSLAVITAYGNARLLTFDNDETTRMPTAEVAHEALLREWPRLAGWIADQQEDLLLRGRLTTALRDWEQSDWDGTYLLAGGRLAQHEAWTRSTDLHLSDAELRFLQESRRQEEAKRSRSRRVRRLVTAGFGVAAAVGIALAVFAMAARDDAQEQAQRAIEATAQAETNEAAAEENAALAESNAAEATRNEAIARARELAASSISVASTDPELATLLALEAFDTAPPDVGLFPEAMIALRQAMDANRLTSYRPGAKTDSVAFGADGDSLIIVESGSRSVRRVTFESGRIGEELWVHEDVTTNDTYRSVAVHPSEPILAVLVLNEDFGGDPGMASVDEEGQDPFAGRILILNVDDGQVIETVNLDCLEPDYGPFYFSADGTLLGTTLRAMDCADDPGWLGFALLDTEDWTLERLFDNATVTMTAAADRILIDNRDGTADLVEWPSMAPIDTFDIYAGQSARYLSPDGRTITYRTINNIDVRPGFWGVATNQQIAWGDGFEGFFVEGGLSYTTSGLILAPSTDADVLYDPSSGLATVRLPTEATLGTAISSDDTYAVTTHVDGVRVWNIGERGANVSLPETEANIIWLNSDMIEEGPTAGLWGFSGNFDMRLAVIEAESGEVLAYQDVVGEGDQLPDGRFVLAPLSIGDPLSPDDDVAEAAIIWDPATGDSVALSSCSALVSTYWAPSPRNVGMNFRGSTCADGDSYFGHSFATSRDGSLIAGLSHDPNRAPASIEELNRNVLLRIWNATTAEVLTTHELTLEQGLGFRAMPYFGDGWVALIDGFPGTLTSFDFRIIDVETGDVVASLRSSTSFRETLEVSSDGQFLYVVTEQGEVLEYSTSTWELNRRWQALDGRPRGMSLSPSDALLAVGGEDERISIWSLNTPEPVLVDRIPLGEWASDSVWIDESTLAAATMQPGTTMVWRQIDLDPNSVIASARANLQRQFSDSECSLYGITSCGPGS